MKRAGVMFLVFALLFSVFFSNTNEASAAEKGGAIDLNNLEQNEQVTIKEITFDEYVKAVAEADGVTEEEVRANSMDLYNILNPSPNRDYMMSPNNEVSPTSTLCSGCSLLQMNVEQRVTSTYRPTVEIYAVVYSNGSFREFKWIHRIALNRGYFNGWMTISKTFLGDIGASKLSGSQIEWFINGDFYENGTYSFTLTGAGEVSAGGGLVKYSGEIGGSYTTSHYEYYNARGYLYSYN